MLEREADKAIREALESQISVALRPMLPYERKVVHSYISKRSDVVTESIGKGVDRKVLIRPKLSGEIEEEVV
jgi:spoIIIJ-associated protein